MYSCSRRKPVMRTTSRMCRALRGSCTAPGASATAGDPSLRRVGALIKMPMVVLPFRFLSLARTRNVLDNQLSSPTYGHHDRNDVEPSSLLRECCSSSGGDHADCMPNGSRYCRPNTFAP